MTKDEIDEIVTALMGEWEVPCALCDVLPAAADLIENQQREIEALKSALHEMAADLVAWGRVDYWLCDDVPDKLHMKYQPKNDGNYENEPCVECVKEYYLQKASGEIDARSRADEGETDGQTDI
nr:MAG TPA: hypothetical protein [Caudoviricetes sp.]